MSDQTNKIQAVFQKQTDFFNTNQSKNVGFRINQLKKIKGLLKDNEEALYEAIYQDFGKSEFETYGTELGLVYQELNTLIAKTGRWAKRKKVRTNLVNFPAKSYRIPEPLGSVLIICPWNYPLQLSLIPAISAIAAGNTLILKPSELTAKTSKILARIINNNFSENFFHVVEGAVEETTILLEQKFDKIFFTGSTQVGKIIYMAAAKNLTPVTLELGGKSPTFVLADCNLKMAAKRIVWSKFINAGQSCVAPDYILVEKSIKETFQEAVKKEIDEQYSFSELKENYLRIINDRNFERLKAMIDPNKVLLGGNSNQAERLIYPTVLKDVTFDDAFMKEEIFGPILPVIEITDLDSAIERVKSLPKPLSCYVYSENRKNINKILTEISFGGGGVNESVMHLSNSRLPFGGVGSSGMGSYHGKAGFDCFTHYKSILDKPTWFELELKYAPYKKWKQKLIKYLLG